MVLKHRKLQRWNKWDYSENGWYFVTICVKDKLPMLGNISDGLMMLNRNGEIINECWKDLPNHYSNCKLDEFVIMPDHFHGIVIINNVGNDVGNGLRPFRTKHGLSEIIRGFKSFSSLKIHRLGVEEFKWHKSYYDRIIRDEKEYLKVKTYIVENPKVYISL